MPIYFAWFTTALLSVGRDANDQNLPQSGRLLYCVIILLPTSIRKVRVLQDSKWITSEQALIHEGSSTRAPVAPNRVSPASHRRITGGSARFELQAEVRQPLLRLHQAFAVSEFHQARPVSRCDHALPCP